MIVEQKLQIARKPSDTERQEAKIQVLKEEKPMQVDELKKEGFNFGSVVFKAEETIKQEKPIQVDEFKRERFNFCSDFGSIAFKTEETIKQEKPWLPTLLTLTTGMNQFTILVFYVSKSEKVKKNFQNEKRFAKKTKSHKFVSINSHIQALFLVWLRATCVPSICVNFMLLNNK